MVNAIIASIIILQRLPKQVPDVAESSSLVMRKPVLFTVPSGGRIPGNDPRTTDRRIEARW